MSRGIIRPACPRPRRARPDCKRWRARGRTIYWLAEEFVKRNYNLKWLLECIMSSQAYQWPATAGPEEDKYVFKGPYLRRMTAEQWVDGVYQLSGQKGRAWQRVNDDLMRAMGRMDRMTVVTMRRNAASQMQAFQVAFGPTLQ